MDIPNLPDGSLGVPSSSSSAVAELSNPRRDLSWLAAPALLDDTTTTPTDTSAQYSETQGLRDGQTTSLRNAETQVQRMMSLLDGVCGGQSFTLASVTPEERSEGVVSQDRRVGALLDAAKTFKTTSELLRRRSARSQRSVQGVLEKQRRGQLLVQPSAALLRTVANAPKKETALFTLEASLLCPESTGTPLEAAGLTWHTARRVLSEQTTVNVKSVSSHEIQVALLPWNQMEWVLSGKATACQGESSREGHGVEFSINFPGVPSGWVGGFLVGAVVAAGLGGGGGGGGGGSETALITALRFLQHFAIVRHFVARCAEAGAQTDLHSVSSKTSRVEILHRDANIVPRVRCTLVFQGARVMVSEEGTAADAYYGAEHVCSTRFLNKLLA